MSYHASFFSIAYTMGLTLFDALNVKLLNSHIFYELYGYKDIGYKEESMDMNDDKREEKITFHQIWTPSQPYFYETSGKWGLWWILCGL